MKVVYDNITGNFIGYGTLANFQSNPDYLEKDIADIYLTQVVWNTSLRDFVNVPSIEERELELFDFLGRLTMEERIAIQSVGETNPIIEDILFLFVNAKKIHLDNPTVINALSYFESLSLLSAGRKETILGI